MLAAFSFASIRAQNQIATDSPGEETAVKTGGKRAEILERLGLSSEQMQQFRRVNGENRPRMRQAQQRLQEANRALDEAVYADAADEAFIQTRLKEVQSAQAEVIKIRTLNELAVRRILNHEQLTRFREARRNFNAALGERRMNKKENRMLNAPNRRLGNRRGQRQRANTPPNN